MPNVDKCVRECEAGLCGDTARHSQNITEIINAERVRVLRNKSAEWIEDFIQNGQKVIQNKVKQDFYPDANIPTDDILLQPSSNDNKIGADLFHVLPNGEVIDIEVKFGDETDKNIGHNVFSKIFGTNCFAEELSVEARREMLEAFRSEQRDEARHFTRLFEKINRAIENFNAHTRNQNSTLTPEQQTYMEQEIINSSGSTSGSPHNHRLKFILTGINLRDAKQIKTGEGAWMIQRVKKLDNSIRRANVFVFNHQTNIQIKFTLNWKNNYKSNNERFPAKLGFGSSSWNVWISVEITELS